ncbi:hypothetical protein E8E12_008862 [Didymella heteroderae]|uniref:Uncharacterized protein n=1 Tax=Didymella heteroderae TaxID=1769908 RepID=A0A9P4WTS5_9PLEO|nr:hypothetical protein E8E12_008862 [Didymella heteroderae]
MSDPTYILRHYHDDCASNALSLADQISDLELNSTSALYSDLRSHTRSQHHERRKRQCILNPMFRTKHCPYHRDCLVFSKRHISNRHRRTRAVRAECTDEAYWDREGAELEHRERMEHADLVTLYYNHGHNAAVIERLRPHPFEGAQDDDDRNIDAHERSSVSVDAHADAEPDVITAGSWTLHLYPSTTPGRTVSDDEATEKPSEYAGRCVSASTAFTYHLNSSGIWELGFANQDPADTLSDPYGCTQRPLAMDCGCCSFNTGFFACSCADIPTEWRSPEEHWRGSLARWIRDKTSEQMWLADEAHEIKRPERRGLESRLDESDVERGLAKQGRGEPWTWILARREDLLELAKQREGEEWDVVSPLSSTGSWRLVDVS